MTQGVPKGLIELIFVLQYLSKMLIEKCSSLKKDEPKYNKK